MDVHNVLVLLDDDSQELGAELGQPDLRFDQRDGARIVRLSKNVTWEEAAAEVGKAMAPLGHNLSLW